MSGLGTALAAWLAAALLRARAAAPDQRLLPPPAPLARRGPARSRACSRPPTTPSSARCPSSTIRSTDGSSAGRTPWASTPSRPTSVGTAYGLQIMLESGLPDGRLTPANWPTRSGGCGCPTAAGRRGRRARGPAPR
ncbi:hypothetical protein ACR6C2_37165 [Streptomyces sp. INA 01156]